MGIFGNQVTIVYFKIWNWATVVSRQEQQVEPTQYLPSAPVVGSQLIISEI